MMKKNHVIQIIQGDNRIWVENKNVNWTLTVYLFTLKNPLKLFLVKHFGKEQIIRPEQDGKMFLYNVVLLYAMFSTRKYFS